LEGCTKFLFVNCHRIIETLRRRLAIFLELLSKFSISKARYAGIVQLRRRVGRHVQPPHSSRSPSSRLVIIALRKLLASLPRQSPNSAKISSHDLPRSTKSERPAWNPDLATSRPKTSLVNTSTFSPKVSVSGRFFSEASLLRKTFQTHDRGISCKTTGEIACFSEENVLAGKQRAFSPQCDRPLAMFNPRSGRESRGRSVGLSTRPHSATGACCRRRRGPDALDRSPLRHR
jgi:hypothetical protein